MNPICWWFGCKPDYEHPCELAPNYIVPCSRCGKRDTSYSDRVGDTPHNRMMEILINLTFRKWWPVKCTCGKRFAHEETDQCLPF